jgi:hypothetical protein
VNGFCQQVAATLPEEPPVEETLESPALIRLAMSKGQIELIRVVSMDAARFAELGKRGEDTLAVMSREAG